MLACALDGSTDLRAEPLTRIADVRRLTREEAAEPKTVLLSGVVTWRNAAGQFVMQDESNGIWIGVKRSQRNKLWAMDDAAIAAIRVGQRVEVEGVSDPAGFAPVVLPRTVRVLGEQELPPAQRVSLPRLFSGSDDCLRVEVGGVVQAFQEVGDVWLLHLRTSQGAFTAEFPIQALRAPSELVDAEVRVTGLAIARFNTRGEITMPRIFSGGSADLIVDVPAIAAFAAPSVPLDRIGAFRPDPLVPHRVRVSGTVTFALPGKFLYLQAGPSAVRVETRTTEALGAGDVIEVSGFVDMSRHIGMLTEAQVRKVGRGPVPEPVAIGPEEIVALNATAIATGQLAKPHDFDGHLVRFPARLLAVEAAADPRQPLRRLTLERGGTILGAILHAGEPGPLDALQPGSVLEVTALVQLEYTPVEGSRRSLVPSRLDVVLRSGADIQVLEAPSWWTPKRLLGVVTLVAVALGAALLWVWQLRRQVQRKTLQLATEMRARRDAAIEFQATLRERNRLAANLHDTLLQTLGGIGFQLEACEAEASVPASAGLPAVHLPVARRMLDHAVDELRGSVWALRSLPLHGLAFSDALQALVERAGAGHDAKIELRTTGDLAHVPDFVAGNLILTAQEALHNALTHGRPTRVMLEVQPAKTADWIALTVRDDGRGFTPGAQRGAAQGHFGLTGMRERIERLNGTLQIESAPGRGTVVHFEVPLRAYDEALA
ncbi:MAG: sensor histidine kinase [Opitutaceae bacterium]|nr:sensor histidine kinase [Opitutaceae bacterium]